ncbi:MAG: 23S rRNA (uracil(1939)-C(5))-methyltransferase RlmD [Lachnospiraceae bacterium]|nr:23S rRNA (uracil(1939)-C(5))-methyltransferase RlmD [Lachnospiraceae bacterium]
MIFKKNDIVTVTIEDIGNDGKGIGKVDGFALFVKDAVVGDVVEARIVKTQKNFAYARLEKVITPSPFRVEPKCAFHRQCGGCQLQTLDYQKQLEFKQNKIRNNLIRIGGFDAAEIDAKMDTIVGMEEPFYYRNKALYPVGTDKEGNPIAGFYAGRTHSIIANTKCHLGVDENEPVLLAVLDYMKGNHVTAYDETTHQGLVRHVLIRKGFTSGELMVCLVVNGDKLPAEDKLVEGLRSIAGLSSISLNVNKEKTNVIMGKKVRTLWGKDTITDSIHVRDTSKEGFPRTGRSLQFHISPLSFYQVNPEQTEKLYSLALEYAGLSGQETVWDLYCGIGTISLFLAGDAKKVCGVEIVPAAIADAKENALRNGIDNAEFFVGKAEEVLPAFYADSDSDMRHPDVIVVDPPRKGCDDACLQTMLQMAPEKIVYVSCDSATLARDLKILCDGGYELQKVRGVDQFGQTVHVETVCFLGRISNLEPNIHVNLSIDREDFYGKKKGKMCSTGQGRWKSKEGRECT